MILQAFIEGDLAALLRAQAAVVATGATRGLRRAASGIRGQIRRNIARAGFHGGGRQLASAVRVSRPRGEGLDQEIVVYSKAVYARSGRRPGGPVDLLQLFAQGARIASARGGWLAIPTEDAPLQSARGRGRRLSPAEMIEGGARLRFIPAGTGRLLALLRLRGRDVVTHVLLRDVTLRPRLDVQTAVDRWTGRLPDLLATEIERAAERSALLRRYGG